MIRSTSRAERSVVVLAHELWAKGDLDGFVALLAENIVYEVNVDGVPYAASANGREVVRARLQLLLDTFEVQAFVIEHLVHEETCTRTRVLGFYKHRKTGERLDIKVSFIAHVDGGLISRLQEIHDAAYVEAFERFVRHLEAAAASQSPPEPHPGKT